MKKPADLKKERLARWRAADAAAATAEREIRHMATADPRLRSLFLRAARLRQEADREFVAILRAIAWDGPEKT